METPTERLYEVPKEVFDRVWELVKEIDDREKHFNGLQSGYRTLASTWLLAAFTGVGFVFSQTGWPVDRELAAVLIALAGALGIFLVWILDVLVYHDLLIGSYVAGLELEQRYPWIPPGRSNFARLTVGVAVRWYIAAFYSAGIATLCILSAVICLLWRSDCKAWSLVPLGLGVLLIGLIVFFTRRSHRRKRNLPEWLSAAR